MTVRLFVISTNVEVLQAPVELCLPRVEGCSESCRVMRGDEGTALCPAGRAAGAAACVLSMKNPRQQLAA